MGTSLYIVCLSVLTTRQLVLRDRQREEEGEEEREKERERGSERERGRERERENQRVPKLEAIVFI